jgi:G3E family GTPase
VGIDDALVLQAQEEIFEMNNGCVCCSGDPAIAVLHGPEILGMLLHELDE